MILVDLEGTLSDHTERLRVLTTNKQKYKGRDPDAWKTYYMGLIDDEPRPHIMELVREWIEEGLSPLVYSTRFINKYNQEEAWLKKHGLWKDVELIQRLPTETKIKGPDLVLQWVRRYEPDIVIDDRDEVRELIRNVMRHTTVYHPNAFLKPPVERADEH